VEKGEVTFGIPGGRKENGSGGGVAKKEKTRGKGSRLDVIMDKKKKETGEKRT